MADPDRTGRNDRWGPSLGYLAVALALVAGALAVWWLTTPTLAPAPPAGPEPVASAASSASAPVAVAPSSAVAVAGGADVPSNAPTQHIPRVRPPGTDQSPDITDYINDGEKPTMTDVINRLHEAGVHTGLGAFNPPGTRPPMIGLAVPEDFALPPGYVRHYQATDDGQRIEPILMFAPDYQPLAADGTPIPIPKDRVVPPELAPPGFPLRRITVPAPINPR